MRIEQDEVHHNEDALVCHGDEPFTGEVITRDSDGRITAIVSYVEGVPSGPQTTWYPDGSKKMEGHVKLGVAVGEWREWHPNGQLAEEFLFNSRGRRVRRQRWDEQGNLTEDKSYSA